jgi:hypothetical protein
MHRDVRIVGIQRYALRDVVDPECSPACLCFTNPHQQIETAGNAEELIDERPHRLRELKRVAAVDRVELIHSLQFSAGVDGGHRQTEKVGRDGPGHTPWNVRQIGAEARNLRDGLTDCATELRGDLLIRSDCPKSSNDASK